GSGVCTFGLFHTSAQRAGARHPLREHRAGSSAPGAAAASSFNSGLSWTAPAARAREGRRSRAAGIEMKKATPGGYGGKPPDVARSVPTGARNTGQALRRGTEALDPNVHRTPLRYVKSRLRRDLGTVQRSAVLSMNGELSGKGPMALQRGRERGGKAVVVGGLPLFLSGNEAETERECGVQHIPLPVRGENGTTEEAA